MQCQENRINHRVKKGVKKVKKGIYGGTLAKKVFKSPDITR